MKSFNTIEEYNNAYRKHFKDTWEAEIKHCQNWFDGERSYFKVGWLENCTDENAVKEKLAYSLNMLKNIDYYVQRNSYGYKKPKTQKDNDLSFIGKGIGWAHSSQIRVPKLKRKTAWKRFYKMFPDLKGMKVISGSSSSTYNRLNASTIKLKKVKK